jgi:hypothetical protein
MHTVTTRQHTTHTAAYIPRLRLHLSPWGPAPGTSEPLPQDCASRQPHPPTQHPQIRQRGFVQDTASLPRMAHRPLAPRAPGPKPSRVCGELRAATAAGQSREGFGFRACGEPRAATAAGQSREGFLFSVCGEPRAPTAAGRSREGLGFMASRAPRQLPAKAERV